MPACSPTRAEILTGVDNHLNGLETITPNQEGKQGYETYLNERVVTVAMSLKNSCYHTLLSGKWHLSWQGEPVNRKYISEPSAKGFENSFTLLGAAAHHFNSSGLCHGCAPPTFLENGEVIERPDGIYSTDMHGYVYGEDDKLHHGSERRSQTHVHVPCFSGSSFANVST